MRPDCDEEKQSLLEKLCIILIIPSSKQSLMGFFRASIFVVFLYALVMHIGRITDYQIVNSRSRRLEDSQVTIAQFRTYTSLSRDEWNPYIVHRSCPLYVLCSTGGSGLGDRLERFIYSLNIAKILEATIVFDDSEFYTPCGHNNSEYLSIITDILGVNLSLTTSLFRKIHGSYSPRDILFTEVQSLKNDVQSGKTQLQCNTVFHSDIQSCNGRWCPTESTYPFVENVKWELKNNHASEMCIKKNYGFIPSNAINIMWHIRNGDICLHCNDIKYMRKVYGRILQILDFSDSDVGSKVNFFVTASTELTEYENEFPNFNFSTEKTPLLQTICRILTSDIFINSGSSIVVAGAFSPRGYPLIIEEERKNLHGEIFKQHHIFTENDAVLMVNGDFTSPFPEVKSFVKSTLAKKLSLLLNTSTYSSRKHHSSVKIDVTPQNELVTKLDAECRLLKNFDDKQYYFVLYGFKIWIKDSMSLNMASFDENDAIITNTSFLNTIPDDEMLNYRDKRFPLIVQMIHHCELESWPYISKNPKKSKQSRVLLLTVVDIPIDEFANFHDDIPYQYANLVLNFKYAKMHGYDMLVVQVNSSEYRMNSTLNEPPYKFQQEELPSLYFVLRMTSRDPSNYDFVLYLDQTLSMSVRWQRRSIDDFIEHWDRSKFTWQYGVQPKNASILMFNTGFNQEFSSPNALLLRSSSPKLSTFIQDWWNESISIGSSREAEENVALHHMITRRNEIRNHLAYFKSESVNWPCDLYGWICKLDNVSEHSEFLNSAISNDLGMDRIQFSAALSEISRYHTVNLRQIDLLDFIRNSPAFDIDEKELKLTWNRFKSQVSLSSSNVLISKSFVTAILSKRKQDSIHKFAVNSFIYGSDFLFQDIFISESKVFFISVPTANFHNKEEMEKSILAHLYVAGTFVPMFVNVTCHFNDIMASNIIGELSHPDLENTLLRDSYLNISVKFRDSHKDFILYSDRPQIIENDNQFNVTIFTMFKTDDAVSVDSFVQYYQQLGVENFIFYIHGFLSQFPKVKELAKMYTRKGTSVTFAEWNFQPYWIHSPLVSPLMGIHNAQVTAMNSVLYRSRDWTKWLGFFDLDEYVFLNSTKGCLKNKLDYTSMLENITTVMFNGADAYINKSIVSSFTLNEIASADVIFENNLKSRVVTKYFVRPSAIANVIVHQPSELIAGVIEQNASTNFYLHFGFEHPGRSKESIVSPAVIKGIDFVGFNATSMFASSSSRLNLPSLSGTDNSSTDTSFLEPTIEEFKSPYDGRIVKFEDTSDRQIYLFLDKVLYPISNPDTLNDLGFDLGELCYLRASYFKNKDGSLPIREKLDMYGNRTKVAELKSKSLEARLRPNFQFRLPRKYSETAAEIRRNIAKFTDFAISANRGRGACENKDFITMLEHPYGRFGNGLVEWKNAMMITDYLNRTFVIPKWLEKYLLPFNLTKLQSHLCIISYDEYNKNHFTGYIESIEPNQALDGSIIWTNNLYSDFNKLLPRLDENVLEIIEKISLKIFSSLWSSIGEEILDVASIIIHDLLGGSTNYLAVHKRNFAVTLMNYKISPTDVPSSFAYLKDSPENMTQIFSDVGVDYVTDMCAKLQHPCSPVLYLWDEESETPNVYPGSIISANASNYALALIQSFPSTDPNFQFDEHQRNLVDMLLGINAGFLSINPVSTWSLSIFAARMVLKRQTSPSFIFPSENAERVFWVDLEHGQISAEKLSKAWADLKERYSLPRIQPDPIWLVGNDKRKQSRFKRRRRK